MFANEYIEKRNTKFRADLGSFWSKSYNYTVVVASLNRDNECSTPNVGIEVEVRNGKLTKFGTCELNAEKAYQFGTIEKYLQLYEMKNQTLHLVWKLDLIKNTGTLNL